METQDHDYVRAQINSSAAAWALRLFALDHKLPDLVEQLDVLIAQRGWRHDLNTPVRQIGLSPEAIELLEKHGVDTLKQLVVHGPDTLAKLDGRFTVPLVQDIDHRIRERYSLRLKPDERQVGGFDPNGCRHC